MMTIADVLLPALLLLPLCAAISCWFIAADKTRRMVLLLTATAELAMAVVTWFVEPAGYGGEILCLDAMGRLVLTLTSALFFTAAVYAGAYLKSEDQGTRRDFQHGLHFSNAPEATFTACLLLFLTSAILSAATRHMGLLWVGIETTTVVSAPLIYFHRHQRSLEATWKYLLICSVAISLALIGNLLLDISMQNEAGHAVDMSVSALSAQAGRVHSAWFKAAFVFLLIGYGAKMGIAPMHTWLPDAHSEAPSVVSALLSGALLNCAFLGIFRAQEVALAAGFAQFSSTLLLAFGFLSMFIAALFIVNLGDFKRMLAYSSVEHMGVLCIALGVGLPAGRGGLLHMIGHSLVKAALFLLAGNILARYHTKSSHDVSGMSKILPVTSALWLGGIIAIAGTPPFVVFMSEFSVLQGLLAREMLVPGAIFLILLGAVFVGMITPSLHMCRGGVPSDLKPAGRESLLFVIPSACLLLAALALGLFLPDWLRTALDRAASQAFHP